MDGLILLGAPVWLGGIALYAWGTWLVVRGRRAPVPARDAAAAEVSSGSMPGISVSGSMSGISVPGSTPGISILKPLKGIDPELDENLRSFFRLDHPEFELLFCLESPRDPAYRILRAVASEFPGVRHRIFFSGAADAGEFRNPKVANLENAAHFAAYDLHLVADSNVRIDARALRALATALADPRVGIASAIVRGARARGLVGRLEAMALDTFYARGMRLAEAGGKPCVMGKAMLYRASVLRRAGGLGALGRYLAEDYMAGFGVRQLGYRAVVAREPIRQVVGRMAFRAFWSRHRRWGRIRKAQAPFAFFAEPLVQAIPLAALGATILPAWTGVSPAVAFAAQLGTLFAWDGIARDARPRAGDLGVWLAREALAPAIWISTALGSDVEWRGRKLRVEFGGTLSGDVSPGRSTV